MWGFAIGGRLVWRVFCFLQIVKCQISHAARAVVVLCTRMGFFPFYVQSGVVAGVFALLPLFNVFLTALELSK